MSNLINLSKQIFDLLTHEQRLRLYAPDTQLVIGGNAVAAWQWNRRYAEQIYCQATNTAMSHDQPRESNLPLTDLKAWWTAPQINVEAVRSQSRLSSIKIDVLALCVHNSRHAPHFDWLVLNTRTGIALSKANLIEVTRNELAKGKRHEWLAYYKPTKAGLSALAFIYQQCEIVTVRR